MRQKSRAPSVPLLGRQLPKIEQQHPCKVYETIGIGIANMSSIAHCITPPTITQFTNRRLAREWKTVDAMVHIYCRDQHGGALCSDCQQLMSYVSLRLERCRFGRDKPTCAKCPVHCSQRERRNQIKVV